MGGGGERAGGFVTFLAVDIVVVDGADVGGGVAQLRAHELVPEGHQRSRMLDRVLNNERADGIGCDRLQIVPSSFPSPVAELACGTRPWSALQA